ncbi:MAG: hypothetical protein Kow00109_27590 [Acidobacteriota bacterium]
MRFRLATWRFTLVVCLLGVAPTARAAQDSDTYQFAYDRGRALGEVAGREDRLAHLAFDYERRREYQEALDGFDPAVHDREVYRVAFRRGFEDGYEAAYQEQVEGEESEPLVAKNPAVEREFAGREELPAGTELKLRLLDSLGTERNEVGDRFRCEVAEPVVRDGRVVVPRGAVVWGEVTGLKRAGRIRGRSELVLAFRSLELPGGAEVPLEGVLVGVEELQRERVEPTDEGKLRSTADHGGDARKVGLAAGIGALIGLLTGGGDGAQKGVVIGAAGGVAGILATKGKPIFLPVETELVVRLEREALVPTGLLRLSP